jgi:hypothetical protein
MSAPEAKRCSKCGEEKPLREFSKSATAKDGLQSRCRQCAADYSREWAVANRHLTQAAGRKHRAANPGYATERTRRWREDNPARAAAQNRRQQCRLYAIAESTFLELRDRPCDICGRAQGDKAHAIDHSHTNGSVRGVLCTQCNTALGKFQDSPELLARAIHYLTRGADYRAVDREA